MLWWGSGGEDGQKRKDGAAKIAEINFWYLTIKRYFYRGLLKRGGGTWSDSSSTQPGTALRWTDTPFLRPQTSVCSSVLKPALLTHLKHIPWGSRVKTLNWATEVNWSSLKAMTHFSLLSYVFLPPREICDTKISTITNKWMNLRMLTIWLK